jgi:hypothetical protein
MFDIVNDEVRCYAWSAIDARGEEPSCPSPNRSPGAP